MKLSYRGTEYEYTPASLEVKESEITGCYRGQPIHFAYTSHVPVPQPVSHLVYRGVHYSTPGAGPVLAPSPVPATVGNLAVADNNLGRRARHQALREAAEIHRSNVQRSLEHRILVARSQDNQWLIQQLEQELHQLA